MVIEELFKFLNKNCDKFLNTQKIELYNYLFEMCNKNYKVKECKYFNNSVYYFIPVEDIERKLHFTPLKQYILLKKLEKEELIKTISGYNRKKYVLICENKK